MGVGMPAELYLDQFGRHIWAVFGAPPYLVGSALRLKKGWRDVDVRMILPDEQWEAMELGEPEGCAYNAKWVSLCLAYSALGRHITGLPIDFQLQQRTFANTKYDQPRSAIGLSPKFRSNLAVARESQNPLPQDTSRIPLED